MRDRHPYLRSRDQGGTQARVDWDPPAALLLGRGRQIAVHLSSGLARNTRRRGVSRSSPAGTAKAFEPIRLARLLRAGQCRRQSGELTTAEKEESFEDVLAAAFGPRSGSPCVSGGRLRCDGTRAADSRCQGHDPCLRGQRQAHPAFLPAHARGAAIAFGTPVTIVVLGWSSTAGLGFVNGRPSFGPAHMGLRDRTFTRDAVVARIAARYAERIQAFMAARAG
jgi:hypothetical protein